MIEAQVREAEMKDWPAICLLHAQLESRMGAKMDLPPLMVTRKRKEIFNPALLGFWVAEVNGQVVQFFYVEKALEICFGGSDPRATVAVRKFQDKAVRLMIESEARMLHCHVPKEFPDVGKHLEDSGFTETGYTHFSLGLVEKP